MSKFSDEKYTELKLKIRRYLQLRPNATGAEIAEVFSISKATAWRLLKKVRRQILEDLKLSTSDNDLAEIGEFLIQAKPEIKRIIFDKDEKGNYKNSAKVRIMAYNSIIAGDEKAMNIKMDTGVYQRNIGKLTVDQKLSPEDEAILEKALNYAIERGRDTTDKAESDTPKATGDK